MSSVQQQPKQEKKHRVPHAKRIQQQELPVFTRALASMLSAGLPVLQALHALESESESATFRRIISKIRYMIQYGSRLSQAVESYPTVFDKHYSSLLRTGEVSGRMAESLERMADYLERRTELYRAVHSAMMYPIIVACIALLLCLGILTWIIPAFDKIYADLGGQLPAPTRVLIAMSRILREHALFVLAIALLLVFAIQFFLRTKTGSYIWCTIRLRLPIVGRLTRKLALVRFSESMAQLEECGVSILTALQLSEGCMNNPVMERTVRKARNRVEQGGSLAGSLKDDRWFPPLFIMMLSVGERCGKTDIMLNHIARFYRSEVQLVLKGLTSMIEPILIVVLGSIVGGMVVSMFLPIFRLHELVAL